MNGTRLARFVMLAALAASAPRGALAEPYLAIQQGYACGACHVNPTGGGLRSSFGVVFAENVLPATGLPAGVPVFSGAFGEFLRVGGDLRSSWTRTEVPKVPATQAAAVDQLRLYADVEAIPDRLGLSIDEALAPGSARALEAYVHLHDPNSGWYAKAGQFYLPFGWRLQDNTAFVREVSGVSMTTPDTGVEIGIERPALSAQLVLSNGAANAGAGSGHQVTAQLVWIRPSWRAGAAASFTNSAAGNRRVAGLFAGLKTGAVAWLGEADLVHDDGFPQGGRTLAALLGEADWALAKGHNLKLTAEYYDPDRAVAEDQQTRWSALYELTPLPFLQLRAGVRRYRGIPQNALDNRRVLFIELHGFL